MKEDRIMDIRKNAGYIITNSIQIGATEIVLGKHETLPDKFVTWECTNGDNYFWGHYIMDELSAKRDFCERCLSEIECYEIQKRRS